MIGSVKLTNNADPDKYNYSGYGKGFDFCSEFSFKDGSVRKNVIIFGADMSSPVQINDKDINILSLHNGSNIFLLANATRIYQLIAKNLEIKDYALCLGNISKDFTINNFSKKNRIKRQCKFFFC